jgi:hypothetical protein
MSAFVSASLTFIGECCEIVENYLVAKLKFKVIIFVRVFETLSVIRCSVPRSPVELLESWQRGFEQYKASSLNLTIL